MVLSASATVRAAPSGPVSDVPVYINYTSFGSTFGGEDPTRVVDLALGSWAEFGSSRFRFYVAGPTTQADCSTFGVRPIFASATGVCGPNCTNTCNCYHAWNYACGENFAIAVNIRDYRYTLGNPYQPPVGSFLNDFQTLITHEVGHNVIQSFGGHVDNGVGMCNMRTYPPVGWSAGRYFCQAEITTMDGASGHSSGPLKIASASTPTSFSAPTTYSGSFEWGFGSIERDSVGSPSVPRDSAFVVTAGALPRLYDFNPDFGFASASPWTTTRRKMTTVHNPYDNMWLQFILEDTDSPNIQVFRSPDRVTWTSLGALRDPNGTPIVSRSAVAAAADPLTHNIVVMVTNWYPEPGGDCSGNVFGCNDALNVFVLKPSNSYSTLAPRMQLNGYYAFGGGAIACGDIRDAAGRQCVAAVIGVDTQRRIWGFDVGVSTIGTPPVDSISAGPSFVFSGATNMQPSATWKPGGPFVLAVTGVDTNVYVSTRASINNGWSGWTGVGVSKRGPSIRASAVTPYYELLVQQ